MAEWTFTVSEVGDFIKRTIDSESLLQSLNVRGEISDFKRSAAGHVYFTLKDERALIRCVWFKQDQKTAGALSEGMRVVARGRLSYYGEQGQINFYIREVKPDGVGTLYLLFEQRRERFRQRGWFDAERKKPLPTFPSAIGVVTSPTGAVIRDIIRIARRRNPGAKIVLYPVKVQGEGAAEEIASGIRAFNRLKTVDALIVGRGGGSFEDLWEFSDEAVVSAIVQSELPVVTAIGHETDFSLADFAADIRAATPSEAAELLVPNAMELANTVTALAARLAGSMEGALTSRGQRVAYLRQALELHGPRELLNRAELRLDNLAERMQTSVEGNLVRLENAAASLAGRLPALSPGNVLERGYAAVFSRGRNTYVSRAAELEPGEEVLLKFADAQRSARVEDGTGG